MIRYETYLAFAQNTRGDGHAQAQSGLKEMATILGEEGWQVCGVWPAVQGGKAGFGLLCQRPIEPSVIEEEIPLIEEIPLSLDGMRQIEALVGKDRHIETVTVTDAMIEEGFTCPRCGTVSHNANDIVERYCGHCHAWTGTQVSE